MEDVRALMDKAEEELEELEDALGQRLGGFADKSLWDVHVRARAPSRERARGHVDRRARIAAVGGS